MTELSYASYLLDIVKKHQFKVYFSYRFCDWIITNTHIYDEFAKLADQIVATGRMRFGAKCISETIRYYTLLHQADLDSDYKISNEITSDMARLYLVMHPDVPVDFFVLKERSIKRSWDYFIEEALNG